MEGFRSENYAGSLAETLIMALSTQLNLLICILRFLVSHTQNITCGVNNDPCECGVGAGQCTLKFISIYIMCSQSMINHHYIINRNVIIYIVVMVLMDFVEVIISIVEMEISVK